VRLLAVLLPFISALFLFGASAEARIYCPLPEHGIWVNPDAAPKELIRLEVETKCQDDQVFARIRAFTKCTPRDCKWGWTKAELRDDGGLRVLLIGFLSSKIIDVRKIGENLDAFVTNITNDGSQPERLKSYSLKRL